LKFLAAALALVALPALANGEDPLEPYLWQARPVIVFAPSAEDPRFVQQMAWLEARAAEMEDRDVVILTDTDPESGSALREKFHPRGFNLILVGKDGGVKLRKPFPWNVRELTRAIDKMPMRRQEMQSGG